MPSAPLLTFDCYGTLIDWEAGILDALLAAYPARGVDPRALLDAFHAAQNELKTSRYLTYRELLTEVARRLAETRGWDASREVAVTIPASIPRWRPFPDTKLALGLLRRAGFRLGILSNIDDDLLEGTLARLQVDFDHLGTAQALGSYKPAPAHFELGARWAEGAASWTHVAQSLFHDVIPASRLGIPVLWVNRRREVPYGGARPVFTAPDLAVAADWLIAREAAASAAEPEDDREAEPAI